MLALWHSDLLLASLISPKCSLRVPPAAAATRDSPFNGGDVLCLLSFRYQDNSLGGDSRLERGLSRYHTVAPRAAHLGITDYRRGLSPFLKKISPDTVSYDFNPNTQL